MSAVRTKRNVVITAEDMIKPYVVQTQPPVLETKAESKISAQLFQGASATKSLALSQDVKKSAPPQDVKSDSAEPSGKITYGPVYNRKLNKDEKINVHYSVHSQSIQFITNKDELVMTIACPELKGNFANMARYGARKLEELRQKLSNN